MIKRSWLLLISALATVAACSNEAPVMRRIGVVLLSDPYNAGVPPLALPDTVRGGVPFTITFATVYASSICWKPVGEVATTNGRQTRITPWDEYVLPAGDAGPCDLLQVGLRSDTVSLFTPGTDTIRVVGRVDPYSTADNNSLDSVSASVVVVP